MDLKCRKTVCKYNCDFTCRAKGICVNSRALCDTYENDPDKKENDSSRCLFKEAPLYAPYREKKSLKVGCSASKCLFNENGVCIANGLTINSHANDPVCMTYIKS